MVLLKSASSDYSRQLGSQLLHKNTPYTILCWVSEQNEQVHSENYIFVAWKLISFHFSCVFYAMYSGSQDLSQIFLSTTFNWAKWVKWVIQCQELNISLWNLFLWIQCPRIGIRDRNSYFYHQMLFSGVILMNTVSKMSHYMVILLGNSSYWIQHPWIRLKSLVPKLYSKLPLTLLFFCIFH